MKMDQKEFMDRVLNVAISLPPANPERQSAPVRSNFVGFSGARKPMVAKTEQKSRISFIPASVQKAASTSAPSPTTQPTMSNDDFRKMLLK